MAVSVPVMYKGMYLGDMTEQQAEMILQVRNMKVVPAFKHMIFDFPLDLVMRSLEEGRSIREIIKEENIDYTQYIGELRDYQTVGVAFLYLSKRSILGDSVGLGKTAEIAALINYLKQKNEMRRFLMAVETSAVSQMKIELMRFTGLNIVELPSESDKMKKAIQEIEWSKVDGIVVKHSALRSDILSKWLALNLKEDGTNGIFDMFVLDESSVIKNMNTKIATYTRNICNICPRVHFLNATTFETNIIDIYNQTDILNPTLLPKKWKIEKNYCVFKWGTYWVKENGKPTMKYKRELSGYKNQAEFKESLKLVYLGRSKAEVGLEKPHVYKVYEVYPSMEQSLALAKGYRYMEVLNCPSLIEELGIEMNRKNVPKLDRLIKLIENDFAEDKVVIYCFYIEAQYVIANELKAIGRKPVILNGDTPDRERWEIQMKFNKGEYDILITNVQKSLNLYGGDALIFYTPLGNPAKLEQVRGRIDRNVDNRTKTYVLLLYKGTDEYKFFTTVAKQRALDSRKLILDAKTAVDFFIESMEGSA